MLTEAPVLCVVGSRRWSSYERLAATCETVCRLAGLSPAAVWSGGCPRGADWLALGWAAACDLPVVVCEANWARYGRAAGVRRSAEMVAALPAGSVVVAFAPGRLAESRGTAFTVAQALRRGLRVWVVCAEMPAGGWASARRPATRPADPDQGPALWDCALACLLLAALGLMVILQYNPLLF